MTIEQAIVEVLTVLPKGYGWRLRDTLGGLVSAAALPTDKDDVRSGYGSYAVDSEVAALTDLALYLASFQ